MTIVRFLFPLALLSALLAGQPVDWDHQVAAARDLRAAGQYAAARQAFQTLMEQAETRPPFLQATLLDDLAVTEQNLGNLVAAERLLKRSISLISQSGSTAEAAGVEAHLGELYLEEGRPREAEALFRRVLDIRRNDAAADPGKLATALIDLAMARKQSGKLADAETHLREGLAILERSYGPGHPLVAGALGPLSATLARRHRYAEAIALTERTWNILSQDPRVGEPDLINTLSSLGYLYAMTGRHDEAERYAKQAIEKAEAIYGPDHLRLGWHLATYASTLERIGRRDQAKQARARSAAILARSQDANPVGHTVNVNALR